MNGAGNRFAIFDARGTLGFQVSKEIVINFCAQKSTQMGEKGADQLIIIREPRSKKSKVFMEIWNQKGFEVNACGNATRCVAWIYMQEAKCTSMVLETKAGLLSCKLVGDSKITVDMGKPKLEWKQIPLAKKIDTKLTYSTVVNLEDSEREKYRQTVKWHYDVHDLNFLYIFFYISGADKYSGAHELIKNSHNKKSFFKHLIGSAKKMIVI